MDFSSASIVILSHVGNQVQHYPAMTFPHGRMRMESDVHSLLWHPNDFPDRIAVSGDFQPRIDAGLAMFWIAGIGEGGEIGFRQGAQGHRPPRITGICHRMVQRWHLR